MIEKELKWIHVGGEDRKMSLLLHCSRVTPGELNLNQMIQHEDSSEIQSMGVSRRTLIRDGEIELKLENRKIHCTYFQKGDRIYLNVEGRNYVVEDLPSWLGLLEDDDDVVQVYHNMEEEED